MSRVVDESTAAPGQRPDGILSPLLTVDSVLFTYHERLLKILLVKRSVEPEAGKWGLPGGIVDVAVDSDLQATALRKLVDKTGIAPTYLDQLETIGDRLRDPRGWSVTVCYTALIAHQACAYHVDTVSDVRWIALNKMRHLRLAFDHRELIKKAQERMRQRALYSILPGYALPELFTLGELQHLHELLIGKALQKRSFRRRIEQAGLLVDSGQKRQEQGRPAALYRLRNKSLSYRFVRNLEG